MAAVDPSTTAFLTIHNMATWMVGHWGQPALREEWGPQLASGEKLASYCLTEPGAGSDAASLSTRAQRQGADYIVNGAKAFISGGGDTNLLIVMARTGGEGAAGISAFAIPADSAGISYGRKEEKMGWNSQSTRPIVFENVRVPAANLLGNEGDGFKIAMKGLDGGRINIGTCSVGAAQGALDAARRYMDERRQFNRRLAEFQALQFKLADMATHLVAARQMVAAAARTRPPTAPWLRDRHGLPDLPGCATDTRRLRLPAGLSLERLVHDTRVHQILEGTNEIMRVIIARQLLEKGADIR